MGHAGTAGAGHRRWWVTTILYALPRRHQYLAAAGLLARRSVLYSDQGNWGDLWRRPSEPAGTATHSRRRHVVLGARDPHLFLRARIGKQQLTFFLPVGQLVVMTGPRSIIVFGLWPALVAYPRARALAKPGFGPDVGRTPPAWAWSACCWACRCGPLWFLKGSPGWRGNHLEGLRQRLEAAGPSPFPARQHLGLCVRCVTGHFRARL